MNFQDGSISPGITPCDLATIIFDAPDFTLSYTHLSTSTSTLSGLSNHLFFTGSLTIDTSNIDSLNLNFLSPPTNQTYTLISYSSLTGTFATVNGLPANYSLDYTPTALLLLPNNSSPNSIPEPTTLTNTTLLLPPRMRRRPRRPI